MTPTDAAIRLSERLLAVDWGNGGFDHRLSRVKLMAEHMRRAAWWVRELGCEGWPFPDLARCANPAIRADPTVVLAFEGALAPVTSDVKRVCVCALHWAALTAAPGVALPELPDPFEPLLWMFERGGGFVSESGFIDVGLASVRWQTWRDHLREEPVVALDLATLDRLDQGT